MCHRDHDDAHTLNFARNSSLDCFDVLRAIHFDVDNYFRGREHETRTNDMRNLHPRAKVTLSYSISYRLEAAIVRNHYYADTLNLVGHCSFNSRNILGIVRRNIDYYRPAGESRVCIDDVRDLLPLAKVTFCYVICDQQKVVIIRRRFRHGRTHRVRRTHGGRRTCSGR